MSHRADVRGTLSVPGDRNFLLDEMSQMSCLREKERYIRDLSGFGLIKRKGGNVAPRAAQEAKRWKFMAGGDTPSDELTDSRKIP
jgi:hypothetical protein